MRRRQIFGVTRMGESPMVAESFVVSKGTVHQSRFRAASLFLVANILMASVIVPASASETQTQSLLSGKQILLATDFQVGASTESGAQKSETSSDAKNGASHVPLRGPMSSGNTSDTSSTVNSDSAKTTVGADNGSAGKSTEQTTEKTAAGNDKASSDSSPATGKDELLKGHVSEDLDTPATILNDLVRSAVARDGSAAIYQKHGAKYGKQSSQLMQKSKDVANFVTAYKGFERSSEAADIILDEQVKVKSKASAIYAYQRKVDESNRRIFSAMMQMANGLGTTDEEQKTKIVDSAMTELRPLVGEEGAKWALERMKEWARALPAAESTDFAAKPLDVLETEKKVKVAIDGALQNDDVVVEIKNRLHKYNHRSKFMRGTAKVVNTTLSIAMLTPNFVSPAAQAAYLAFCVATGGPEDAKLLQALYYDQRFQSRWKVYSHKAELAANNYNMSLLSKNAVALKFSQSVLTDMESGKSGCVAGDTVASGLPVDKKKEPAKKAASKRTNRLSERSKENLDKETVDSAKPL